MKSLKKSDKQPQSYDEIQEHPVILEKPVFWSRAFVWLIVVMTVSAVGWALIAEIEEAVPATGKLEPEGATKDVQAPSGGVIRSVQVKEGQTVKAGEVVVTLDPTGPMSDRETLNKAKASLEVENQFYTAQLNNFQRDNSSGITASIEFTSTQDSLLAASQAEFLSRVAAAENEASQLQIQYAQAQQQLASQKNVSVTNQGILAKSQQILANNQQIVEEMRPVAESGALSRLQFRQQEQRTQSAQSDVLNRKNQIESSKAEIERLEKEGQRLEAAIAQSREKLNNTISQTRKDLLARIADNQKKIAEIDGQLSKAKLILSYQEIKAPISGTVFNMQPAATAGGVISNATTTQPLMTIVPNGNLSAKVYITNQDIGFLQDRIGALVEVRVDSFPSSEFGTIKGKLLSIGSDALPPTQIRQYYSFPAKISLEKQTFAIGSKNIPLQAGMSVSANIIVRKRSVMSIFMSQFVSKTDAFKNVR